MRDDPKSVRNTDTTLEREAVEKDAIASSDITKVPFVTAIALRRDLRISSVKRVCNTLT